MDFIISAAQLCYASPSCIIMEAEMHNLEEVYYAIYVIDSKTWKLMTTRHMLKKKRDRIFDGMQRKFAAFQIK